MKHALLALALLLALAPPLLATAQSRRATCQEREGTFESVLVTDPTRCHSPIGMCTSGVLEGGIEGTYDFTFLSMIPDPLDPFVVHYTGRSVITTAAGHLYGEDTGTMRFAADGTAAFVTTVSVLSGDGCFRDAGGRVVAPGVLDMTTGNAAGEYYASLCGRPGFRRCF